MRKIGMFAGIFLFILPVVYAGDWYLVDIESPRQMQITQEVAEYARGKIGGRFLMSLNEKQLEILAEAGIKTELAAKDFPAEKLFIVIPGRPEVARAYPVSESLFSSKGGHLAAVNAGREDELRKAGYVVIPISRLKTPLYFSPNTAAIQFADEYPSDSLAGLISMDSLLSYDTRLEDFQTRYITTDSILSARDWLVAKFQEFGYTEVVIDTFYYGTTACHNVICYKEGTAEPDKLIVVGGHYDSINSQSPPEVFAPGADDNGSGTAAVLELARIFKDVETKKSFMFVAFSAEEVGLVGSYELAERLYNQGTDVEFMVNFDMVAYTEDGVNDVTLFSGTNTRTVDVFSEAATRVTTLIPYYGGTASNSDHASFNFFGYPVVYVQEGDFNFGGWHTNLDISSRLDFPYFAELMQMSAAAVGYIDQAAHKTTIEAVIDVGDGQSLRVIWGECNDNYIYSIFYGTESGNYTDTIVVPAPGCIYDIQGLTTGQNYYITVAGINPEGYGPLYLVESMGASYVEPRAPADFTAEPDFQKVILDWDDNTELDFSHYRILRKPDGGDWTVLADNITSSQYEDLSAAAYIDNAYTVLAVDNDMNASDSSAIVSAVPATFDRNLLFVDETASGGPFNPTEEQQAAFYGSLFSQVDYQTFSIGIYDDLNRSVAGQYKSMFWIDDDLTSQLLAGSIDSLTWYLNYNTNVFLAGWQTLYWIYPTGDIPPGEFAHDHFGITSLAMSPNFDFNGAYGKNGWPDLEIRPDNPFSGPLPSISVLEVLPGAEVIYTFKSNSGNPDFEDKPAGVLFDNGSGKRIALTFPLYQLTPSGAEALIQMVYSTFGISLQAADGDVNEDSVVNMKDITFLLYYLYKGGPSPGDPNLGDVDANCIIDLNDAVYMINFLYKGGPDLNHGCVE